MCASLLNDFLGGAASNVLIYLYMDIIASNEHQLATYQTLDGRDKK